MCSCYLMNVCAIDNDIFDEIRDKKYENIEKNGWFLRRFSSKLIKSSKLLFISLKRN